MLLLLLLRNNRLLRRLDVAGLHDGPRMSLSHTWLHHLLHWLLYLLLLHHGPLHVHLLLVHHDHAHAWIPLLGMYLNLLLLDRLDRLSELARLERSRPLLLLHRHLHLHLLLLLKRHPLLLLLLLLLSRLENNVRPARCRFAGRKREAELGPRLLHRLLLLLEC